jgi:RNA polymerase subunit RPABC4/transcription elongation factor Spt4
MSAMPTTEVLACIAAVLLSLMLPSMALQRCRSCSALSLRTLERRHRCPSQRQSMLYYGWVGFVMIWASVAIAAAALL